MDRRAYLTALGAAAAVSGCSEGDSTARTTDGPTTPTERGRTTTEQSPTEDPPDQTPRVADAGLLLDRGEYAALDDDVESVGRDGILVVGTEYALPVSDGSARGLVEVRVLDSDGTKLSTASEEIDAVVTGDSEFYTGTSSFSFDTASQERGSYTAEVLVTSDGYGTSASTEVPVDIVEPLGAGEVEMYIAEFPDDAVAGEEFDWTLGFRNLSDRDSSVVTDIVTFEPTRDEPVALDISYRENVPAREAIQVERENVKISRPGAYTYRIDELDAEVSFTIGPPAE